MIARALATVAWAVALSIVAVLGFVGGLLIQLVAALLPAVEWLANIGDGER